MLIILGLVLILTVIGVREYTRHQKELHTIPVRIHVNGTRGKSSVTRLIAGALRAGGLHTVAKTTGSAPRVILEDGNEVPIKRAKGANIIEQIKVIRYLARRKPRVMVIECMAVQPEYQWICEHQIVHSTIGVITNSRPDHIREMGPTLSNITHSLCNTLPPGRPAFTSEKKMFPLMNHIAGEIGTALSRVDDESVSDEEMRYFGHLEHKDNVALALKIAEQLGVSREVALEGMYRSAPDVGALKVHKISEEGKELMFVNALAANDPESTYAIWEKLLGLYDDLGTRLFLLNSRSDRLERSDQLVEMMQSVEFDHLLISGEKTDKVINYCYRWKLPGEKIINLGGSSSEQIFQKVTSLLQDRGTLMAIGNIHGGGGEIADYLRQRSDQS